MKNTDELDQRLESVLRMPLEDQLGDDFTFAIQQKLELKARAEYRRNLMMMGIVMGTFVICSAVGLLVFLPASMYQMLLKTALWGGLIALQFVLFQWIEYKLLRRNLGWN